MSTVVPFAPSGSPDLVAWLEHFIRITARAEQKVLRAKSMDTCLRYYSEWLQLYYQHHNGLELALYYVERSIGTMRSERTRQSVSALRECIEAVRTDISGSMPWVCMHNFHRFRDRAAICLKGYRENFSAAMIAARRLGARPQAA